MKWRMYLTPKIGDGLARETAFRPLLSQFINTNIGEGYHTCHLKSKDIYWVLCWAEDATHTAIGADSRFIVLSPLWNNETDWISWLQESEVTLSANLLTKLEGVGINTAWLTGSHKVRDLMRYIRKLSFVEQKNAGDWENADSPIIKAIFRAGLNTTVNQLTPAQRQRALTWLQKRGIETSWITPSTTIRAVVHYVVENMSFPKVYFNGVEL